MATVKIIILKLSLLFNVSLGESSWFTDKKENNIFTLTKFRTLNPPTVYISGNPPDSHNTNVGVKFIIGDDDRYQAYKICWIATSESNDKICFQIQKEKESPLFSKVGYTYSVVPVNNNIRVEQSSTSPLIPVLFEIIGGQHIYNLSDIYGRSSSITPFKIEIMYIWTSGHCVNSYGHYGSVWRDGFRKPGICNTIQK